MMFKEWYKRKFGGGGNAAEQYDNTDATPNNNKLDIRVGNNTYSMPKELFKNVGFDTYGKESYQSRAFMAGLYGAYRLSTGKDLSAVASNGLGTMTEAGRNAMVAELKRWYLKESGQELSIPSNWNNLFLDELTSRGFSFQDNFEGYTNSGAVQVNGTEYVAWRNTQPQLQPGYSEQYGAPVGKDSKNNYIYAAPDGAGYLTNTGKAVTDFAGLTDMRNRPIVFNSTTGVLEYETGTPVAPITTTPPSVSPVEDAFQQFVGNQYYNDLFSLNDNTTGRRILDNKTSLYEKEADNALALGNASRQTQAMIQAQTVKQVTDQIRAERLSQLRAGMSESQLADRELQMLMGTLGQTNMQTQMANQEATAAQFAKTTAREQAFNDYIADASVLSQSAAATYASEAGDLTAAAVKYMRTQAALGKPVTYDQAIQAVSVNPNGVS